ncbi:hypothetical protein EOJ36_00690 [Sandaracinomonas limnophila]|uniref:Peptidase S74 domain-containing protein n=1 Tax=Sandaracinomonas limnophila TaxID=1862386 RepID=A0A437PWA6_9BACT|nr:tail fiber domain-containing protein [Sandaracinomonas limnophila]RVU26544.1 hypothetical protein EOJ36_00690 [Sandaracinomonas limnophila]
MKKFYAILLLLFISNHSFSQSEKGIHYQAVILDPKPLDVPGIAITGQPLSNGKVWVKFSLKNISEIEYEEVQQTITDEFGLIILTIGKGEVLKNNGKYPNFDAIQWDSNTKSLQVSINFDGGNNYKEVSNQPLNYTPYAFYAESVDYKNVRSAPKNLSDFANDVGFLVNKDLEPINKEIKNNTNNILSLGTELSNFESKNANAFLIVDQQIHSINSTLQTDSTKILQLANSVTTLNNAQAAFNKRLNDNSNQIEQVLHFSETIQSTVNNLGGTFENLNNKSTSIQNDATSTSKYPSVKLIKDYVDATIGTATSSVTDITKEPIILAGTSSQYYRGDKSWQILDKTAVNLGNVDNTADVNKPISTAQQTALNLKANTSDVNTSLALKEDANNKSTDITADATSTTKYPSVKIIKDYVDATISSGVADASSSLKGKIKLTGDLAGTADSPTVPGLLTKEPSILAGTSSQYYRGDKSWQTLDKSAVDLANVDNTADVNKPVSTAQQTALNLKANTLDVNTSLALKEDANNKSTDITADATSTTKYPSVKIIKDYVDATVSSGVADASSSLKGKIKLTGDLAGTADSPTVPGLLTKEPSILAGTSSQYYRGDKSWQTLDKSAVNLGNVDNIADVNKPVSTAQQTALDAKANKSYVDQNFVDRTTDYQSITGFKLFGNNIGMDLKPNGVPSIIEFENGSKLGDIQNINEMDPDSRGSIDLFAPWGAEWTQLNYGNYNYLTLKENESTIEFGPLKWTFNGNNGNAIFPRNLIVGDNPDDPTTISSTNPDFTLRYNDDNQNPTYITGIKFTEDDANILVGDPNRNQYRWRFKDDGATYVPGNIFLGNNSIDPTTITTTNNDFTIQYNDANYHPTYISGSKYTEEGVQLFTGDPANLQTWYFSDDGSTRFPGLIKIGNTQFPSVSGDTGDVLTIQADGTADWQAPTVGGANNIPDANTSTTGLLTSTDYTRFDNKQDALTNPITGTGTNNTGELAFYDGTNSINSDSKLYWNNLTKRLGIGMNTPNFPLVVRQNSTDEYGIQLSSPEKTPSSANGSSIGFVSETNNPSSPYKGLFQLDGDGNMVFRTMQADMYFDNFNDPGQLLQPNYSTINFRIGPEAGQKKGMGLNSDGNLHVDGTIESSNISISSDIRLKQNIFPLKNSIDLIKQLNPVKYDKKQTLKDDKYAIHENGFIAQEVQKILPQLVKESDDKDKILSLNYIGIIPILTKGIQEQQQIIETQNKRIEKLEKIVNSLLKP